MRRFSMVKKTPPFSRKPLKQKNTSSADEFINAAEDHIPTPSLKKPVKKLQKMPWEESKLRNDVFKIFNLRIPERDFQKLKYLSKESGDSMHKLCLDILLPKINRKINELTQK